MANAGGVTVSYLDWVQGLQQFFWTEEEVNHHLERMMVRAEHRVRLRVAALTQAIQRVADALYTRGIYP